MTARGVRVLSAEAPDAEWLAARRAGIGASEIAAVAGLSGRRGPWDIWDAKVHGTEYDSTDEMRWGQFIEGRIVEWWARETGRHVGNGGLFRSPVHPWLLATPDALVLEYEDLSNEDRLASGAAWPGRADPVAVVDAKNAGWHMGADWDEDGAPLDYVCQITWQMLAVGVREGYLVAAIGGKPPVERHFHLDDDLAGELVQRGTTFWKLVQHRTPPPVDGSAPATRWLNARFEPDPGAVAELDDGHLDLLRQTVALGVRIKELEVAQRQAENALKAHLGERTSGTYKGREYVTWKQVERAGYEVKPTVFRKLHIPASIKKEMNPYGDD